MSAPRGEFSSKLGFLMAAAGSAVGLGNIWGFPTQVATNGGAAFLLVYLVLAFCLAFPALMAELIIGRHAKANAVEALRSISDSRATANIGALTGYAGMLTACMILGFYAILAGWMVSHALASAAEFAGLAGVSEWFETHSTARSLAFTALFMVLTISIICGGVKEGIEKWCSRLMPSLLVILVMLIGYVLTLDGAADGVKAYLVPDFSRLTNPKLIIGAMGQAFFSLSLGVGTMLIYGSYVSDRNNIVSLGRSVTLLDVGIAFIAGLLIIPAMYVAQHNGVQIYDADGNLIQSARLIFTVLPAMFDTMGGVGAVVSLLFFIFMSVAALTSTISILEVPVAYAVESHNAERRFATIVIGAAIFGLSTFIIFSAESVFNLIAVAATQYGEPIVGLMMCIFAGWVMHRNKLLQEIRKGNDDAEQGWFWKIWPTYVRFVCPIAILIVFMQTLRG
jgi:NSS family neurotransmitter:Na+ symporter